MKYILSLICPGLLLVSCGHTKKPEEVETPKPQEIQQVEQSPPQLASHQLIGKVTAVNESEGFVLIQQFRRMNLPSGTLLTSYGESGERSNLRVSGEKMGLFIVADIRGGKVFVGDAVEYLKKRIINQTKEIPESPES